MKHTVRRAIAVAALGSATVVAYLMLSTGIASADTHVCVGGYGDNLSLGIANAKAAQGYPCDVPIAWPASIGLPGEPTNVQGSLDVGVPATVDAYYQAGGGNGEKVVIEGTSLGSLAVAQAGDAIRIQNGGVIPPNLEVITNGNPFGDSGIANDPGLGGIAWDVISPFFGVPQDIPQMGVNRLGVNGVWENGANQWPQTQIAQVSSVNQNHILPDQRAAHDTYVTEGAHGPVVNEVYAVGENPITAAANANGTPIPPPIDAFFDVTFPVNNPALPGPFDFQPPVDPGLQFPAAMPTP